MIVSLLFALFNEHYDVYNAHCHCRRAEGDYRRKLSPGNRRSREHRQECGKPFHFVRTVRAALSVRTVAVIAAVAAVLLFAGYAADNRGEQFAEHDYRKQDYQPCKVCYFSHGQLERMRSFRAVRPYAVIRIDKHHGKIMFALFRDGDNKSAAVYFYAHAYFDAFKHHVIPVVAFDDISSAAVLFVRLFGYFGFRYKAFGYREFLIPGYAAVVVHAVRHFRADVIRSHVRRHRDLGISSAAFLVVFIYDRAERRSCFRRKYVAVYAVRYGHFGNRVHRFAYNERKLCGFRRQSVPHIVVSVGKRKFNAVRSRVGAAVVFGHRISVARGNVGFLQFAVIERASRVGQRDRRFRYGKRSVITRRHGIVCVLGLARNDRVNLDRIHARIQRHHVSVGVEDIFPAFLPAALYRAVVLRAVIRRTRVFQKQSRRRKVFGNYSVRRRNRRLYVAVNVLVVGYRYRYQLGRNGIGFLRARKRIVCVGFFGGSGKLIRARVLHFAAAHSEHNLSAVDADIIRAHQRRFIRAVVDEFRRARFAPYDGNLFRRNGVLSADERHVVVRVVKDVFYVIAADRRSVAARSVDVKRYHVHVAVHDAESVALAARYRIVCARQRCEIVAVYAFRRFHGHGYFTRRYGKFRAYIRYVVVGKVAFRVYRYGVYARGARFRHGSVYFHRHSVAAYELRALASP